MEIILWIYNIYCNSLGDQSRPFVGLVEVFSISTQVTHALGLGILFLRHYTHSSRDSIPMYISGRSCPVGRVLSSWPEGPGSKLARWKLSCILMVPGACKFRRGCNVLQVSIQIILLKVSKRESHIPPRRIKIAMAWLRIIFRDESQTVGNRPLA